jgi:hypothetical protein
MYDIEAEREMAPDVLEEDPLGPALDDDAADVRPEVALVLDAEALAGGAEWLARISRKEDIHRSTPASAVEGGKVVPDRRRIQGLIFHPCHESSRCIGFPLDVTHSPIAGLGDGECKVEPASSGAQGQAKHWGGT